MKHKLFLSRGIALISLVLLLVGTINAQQNWTQTVTVNPKATVTFDFSSLTQINADPLYAACQDAEITLTFTGTPPFTTTLTLMKQDGPGGWPVVSNPFPTTFDVGTNLTPVPGVANTYTATLTAGEVGSFAFRNMTVTDAKGCTNTVDQFNITVNPKPTISISPLEVCQNAPITINLTGADAFNLEFSFTGSSPATLPTVLTGIHDGHIIDAGSPGTFNFTLVELEDANGCLADLPVTATVIVHPTPTVEVVSSADPLIFCAGSQVTLSLDVRNRIASFTDGATSQSAEVIFHGDLPLRITQPSIELPAGTSVDIPLTSVVPQTVVDLLQSGIPGDSGYFDYDPNYWLTINQNLVDFAIGLPGSGSFNSTITIPSTKGTYKLNPIDILAAGCPATITVDVEVLVNELPTVTLNAGDICQGETKTLTFTGEPNFTLNFTATKDGSPFTGLGSQIVTSNTTEAITAGEYGNFEFTLVSLTDGNTCTATPVSPVSFRVKPIPTVEIVTPPSDAIMEFCAGAILPLTLSGTNQTVSFPYKSGNVEIHFVGDQPLSIGYTITPAVNILPANPLIVQTPGLGDIPSMNHDVTIPGSGTYTLANVVLDANGCTNTLTPNVQVKVNALPTVRLLVNELCEGEENTIQFTSDVTNPTFTLVYKIKGIPGQETSYKCPQDLGVPSVWNVDATSTTGTYNAPILSGTPGTFTFGMYSINDGTCSNINPDINTNIPGWGENNCPTNPVAAGTALAQ